MSFCIVSAADSGYFEYLQGLLDSLRALAPPMVVIDLGLSAEQRAQLERNGVRLATFSYPLDYPARRQVETAFPGFGAMLCRPYLNEIVTGYETLVWLDADTWAQRPTAVLEFVAEAQYAGIAAVPEIDRGYFKFTEGPHAWDIEMKGLAQLFGPDIASRMAHVPVINSGVWAARAQSPLWPAWRKYLQQGLAQVAVVDDLTRTVEQVALNVAIRLERITVRRFPATYNWLACLLSPAWHAGRWALVDPNPPYDAIRILHISAHLVGKTVTLPVFRGKVAQVGPIALTRQAIESLKVR